MQTRNWMPMTGVLLGLILAGCGAAPTPGSPADKVPPASMPSDTIAPTPTPEPVNTPAPGASGATADIAIQGFAFSPADITVKAGTEVRWTNKDTADHTVAGDDGSWASGGMAKGDSYSRVFDTVGTFTYKCGIHPSMKGTITVSP